MLLQIKIVLVLRLKADIFGVQLPYITFLYLKNRNMYFIVEVHLLLFCQMTSSLVQKIRTISCNKVVLLINGPWRQTFCRTHLHPHTVAKSLFGTTTMKLQKLQILEF